MKTLFPFGQCGGELQFEPGCVRFGSGKYRLESFQAAELFQRRRSDVWHRVAVFHGPAIFRHIVEKGKYLIKLALPNRIVLW